MATFDTERVKWILASTSKTTILLHKSASRAQEKWRITAGLLVDIARRLEVLGRAGIEYNGRVWTSAQLELVAGGKMLPLPPFATVQALSPRIALKASDVHADILHPQSRNVGRPICGCSDCGY